MALEVKYSIHRGRAIRRVGRDQKAERSECPKAAAGEEEQEVGRQGSEGDPDATWPPLEVVKPTDDIV